MDRTADSARVGLVLTAPDFSNLPWEQYRGFAPSITEGGPVELSYREPPSSLLRDLRRFLRDPALVLWFEGPSGGLFVAQLQVQVGEHGCKPDPFVKERGVFATLWDAVAVLGRRSERLTDRTVDQRSVFRAVIDRMREDERRVRAAQDVRRELDDAAKVAHREQAAERGSVNVPREDRLAVARPLVAALERSEDEPLAPPPPAPVLGYRVGMSR